MFREIDRAEMLPYFDLWSHHDVSTYANSILDRLETGDMPCDEGWPPEKIAIFSAWIVGGMPP